MQVDDFSGIDFLDLQQAHGWQAQAQLIHRWAEKYPQNQKSAARRGVCAAVNQRHGWHFNLYNQVVFGGLGTAKAASFAA